VFVITASKPLGVRIGLERLVDIEEKPVLQSRHDDTQLAAIASARLRVCRLG